MATQNTQIVDIGYHKLGLFRVRFSRCTGCGQEFPHASKLTVGGYEETRQPMRNGEPVTECECGAKK